MLMTHYFSLVEKFHLSKECQTSFRVTIKRLGKKINIGKSQFIVDTQISQNKINLISVVTGFMHQFIPFKYLEVPIFQGRCKLKLFDNLVNVSTSKIDGRACKLLSKGVKPILINHILCRIPIYCLSKYNIPRW